MQTKLPRFPPRQWSHPVAAAMAVVVLYSQVVAPPLAQAGFWEERRHAIQGVEGSRGRVGSVNTLALGARSTLASPPLSPGSGWSEQNLIAPVTRFSPAQPKGFTPPIP
ncbi:MAG: hypothetical protein HYZ73_01775, partial [Elusimicrobia bacterium]|nr:hypothetical protein [Elusimicrobiota bacterium]